MSGLLMMDCALSDSWTLVRSIGRAVVDMFPESGASMIEVMKGSAMATMVQGVCSSFARWNARAWVFPMKP